MGSLDFKIYKDLYHHLRDLWLVMGPPPNVKEKWSIRQIGHFIVQCLFKLVHMYRLTILLD